MTREELRRLARLGAEDRAAALQLELATIYRAFPDLQQARSVAAPNPYTAGVRDAVAGVRGAVGGAVARRRPRRMSAAARRRIAAAQRKRWADWREKNGQEVKERIIRESKRSSSRRKK